MLQRFLLFQMKRLLWKLGCCPWFCQFKVKSLSLYFKGFVLINKPNLSLFWLNTRNLKADTQVATQVGIIGSCGRNLRLGIKRIWCSTYLCLSGIYLSSVNNTAVFLWSVNHLPSRHMIQLELTSPFLPCSIDPPLSQWGIIVLCKILNRAELDESSKGALVASIS